MTDDPSTPIQDARDVRADERAALEARTPPFDGVRTYGDLVAVRQAPKPKPKAADPA